MFTKLSLWNNKAKAISAKTKALSPKAKAGIYSP